MKGEKRERWLELAEQAVTEQDPDKFLQIVRELNQLLCEKEQRLTTQRAENPPNPSV
jgi:hypothetical protein